MQIEKKIDRQSQQKLYVQIYMILKEKIENGEWSEGIRIPSEDELCKTYDVSKITVRLAISELETDGFLRRRQGKGTFVTGGGPVIGVAMRSTLTEEMFGKEVKAEKEMLKRGISAPPAEIREFIKEDQDYYHILCRRNVNGFPAYLDESFIPSGMLPGVESVDFTNVSLFSLLQEKAVHKVFKVVQTMEVMTIPGDIAALLDLEAGAAVLAVHRLLLDSDEAPVGYTRFIGRTDRYRFRTEFERIH